ncbi:MAG TPA: acetyl-CoA carboxylase biotin carboxyl carrier protein [Candidatus Acidoferrales bacterium]|nr:acetyl-CoA carboxylase biotin carboxyl carrier protein [Candidatus Acidoferrales bacterium]
MKPKDKVKDKKTRSQGKDSSSPDLAAISEILSFMDQHSLEEFEYQNGDMHVRLRKAGTHGNYAFRAPHSAPEIFVASPPPASQVPAAAPPQPAAAESTADLHVIKSPIVGTFYSSPSPGANSFVRIGDHVTAGQVLCIIEAMKLMNEIEADVAGEVMRIFVENGQPVEYGEPLFAIHPSRKQ